MGVGDKVRVGGGGVYVEAAGGVKVGDAVGVEAG
jgi:hypothetical protein